MRAMLIAVAVLAAVGCGPADERERDAAACPVATTDRVSVTAYFEVEWEADVTPIDGFGASVETEASNEPISFSTTVLHVLGERIPFADLDELRSTRATVRLLDDSNRALDSRTVTLDRNCDLLVEIAQSGDDPPRIDDVRWIPRGE